MRFGGPLPDSNFWGRHLVIGLPLAVALALRAHRHRHRAATAGWVAAVSGLGVSLSVAAWLRDGLWVAGALLLALLVWRAMRVRRRPGMPRNRGGRLP